MFRNKLNCLRRCSNQATNSFSVTTPIFYVNAAPHIGHLYSAVIADTLCRYQRLRFPTCNVRLTTGTDEHGSKIQQAANDHEVNVAQYCDTISGRYSSVFREASIHHTDFVRTTEERHRKAVTEFWKCLQRNGHIYSAAYSGWYCVSDETFLTESQVRLDPETEVHRSMESGHPVEWTEELNYMFRLSAMQNDLINWVKHNDRIRPKKFQKILLDMLNEKLPDVSISRPIGRVHWGIPVPDDATQTVYVWLDALVNYLTTCGYPNYTFLDNWPPSVQVLGKDILKFHGVYWPAFLMAADLEPPRELLVHSHWTVDGQKMSKSKHNVVDPVEAAKTYTMEGLRYFLLREGVAHSDGNFSRTKAVRILNSELADTLGNLLSRVCALSLNPRQIYPALEESRVEELLNEDSSRRLLANLQQMTERCGEHYNERNLHLVVDTVIATLHAANAFFESMKPWELRSKSSIISTTNLSNAKKLETILGMTMDALRVCAIILQPIVPQLSGRLLDKLSVTSDKRLWGNLTDTFATASLKTRHMPERPLNTGDPVLFRRIILKDPLIEDEAVPAKQEAEVQMSNRQAKKAARKAKNQ